MQRGPASGRPLGAGEINADRFWSKVQIGAAGECWEWTGATRVSGYGSVGLISQRRSVPAHRAALALTAGSVADGVVVKQGENVREAFTRGRMVRFSGDLNPVFGVHPECARLRGKRQSS